MDSKEVLETFGISKKFGIVLFIQTIVVFLGCFLALQYMYKVFIAQSAVLAAPAIINLLLFVFLIYYSFIGFRKDEKYFKIAVYIYIICLCIVIFGSIVESLTNVYYIIPIICVVINLVLVCYFAKNLDNYDKAKTAILLVVVIEVICYLSNCILLGGTLDLYLTKLMFVIPGVSFALTYIARYDKDGFKQLNK